MNQAGVLAFGSCSCQCPPQPQEDCESRHTRPQRWSTDLRKKRYASKVSCRLSCRCGAVVGMVTGFAEASSSIAGKCRTILVFSRAAQFGSRKPDYCNDACHHIVQRVHEFLMIIRACRAIAPGVTPKRFDVQAFSCLKHTDECVTVHGQPIKFIRIAQSFGTTRSKTP